MFTQLAYAWLMYEVAANVQPESTLPFLTCAPFAELKRNRYVSWEQLVSHLDHHQAASPSVSHQA